MSPSPADLSASRLKPDLTRRQRPGRSRPRVFRGGRCRDSHRPKGHQCASATYAAHSARACGHSSRLPRRPGQRRGFLYFPWAPEIPHLLLGRDRIVFRRKSDISNRRRRIPVRKSFGAAGRKQFDKLDRCGYRQFLPVRLNAKAGSPDRVVLLGNRSSVACAGRWVTSRGRAFARSVAALSWVLPHACLGARSVPMGPLKRRNLRSSFIALRVRLAFDATPV